EGQDVPEVVLKETYRFLSQEAAMVRGFPVRPTDPLTETCGVYMPGGSDAMYLTWEITRRCGKNTAFMGEGPSPRTVEELVYAVADIYRSEAETLLRPAAAPENPADVLLRPAQGVGEADSDVLLRPAAPEEEWAQKARGRQE